DLDAMRHNLNHYRALVGDGVKMMAMVKASCYGNGNFEVADMLDKQGVNYLAVAFADEGVTLREKGIAMPIVVLNADSDSFALMVANRLEPEIYNFRSLERFIAAVRDAGETSWPRTHQDRHRDAPPRIPDGGYARAGRPSAARSGCRSRKVGIFPSGGGRHARRGRLHPF
ncbi:alanine racemase, partial [human gut metagenome]